MVAPVERPLADTRTTAGATGAFADGSPPFGRAKSGQPGSVSTPNASPAGAAARPPVVQHSESVAIQRDSLTSILGSAGISLVFHGLILILLTMVTWAVGGGAERVMHAFTATITEEPKSVGPRGGFRFPGTANIDRPNEPNGSLEPTTIHDLAAMMESPTDLKPMETESPGSQLDKTDDAGLGRSNIIGIGPGAGFGAGSGTGSGGPGRRSLAGGGPVGSMWGVGDGQRAESIVYVLDRSGSMSDTFSLLQRELMRALGTLEPDQLFNVIWFSEGKATELAPRMLKATLENKREAFEAIKRIVPSGQTEPIDAIRRGLGYRPDVMFMLSDGDFGEENDKVIRLIKERNRDKKTTVNTILFVYDTTGDGQRVLKTIAETNNGTFKHVTDEDVR